MTYVNIVSGKESVKRNKERQPRGTRAAVFCGTDQNIGGAKKIFAPFFAGAVRRQWLCENSLQFKCFLEERLFNDIETAGRPRIKFARTSCFGNLRK